MKWPFKQYKVEFANLIPRFRIDSELCYMIKPANGGPKLNNDETVEKDNVERH